MEFYKITHEAPKVHGGMMYGCPNCGQRWWMLLEIGVEDHGRNGKPHQPCPFSIPCDCGGFARDISGYMEGDKIRIAKPGTKFFAYDNSGKPDACGKMSIYIDKAAK